ncbi:hypothetical protein A2960_02200 [Candidatus Gottesmanbacteria bacterium RIFCSPLOWO2_01_FULL_39_12b]|uniref:O-antigen ligase-related domain-containing protein n=1 Tax=Candidatus Gottesmanbacteria bacterium RIFCSPLOWO2_01_FULL_39_12b TaxID=1798388 RepID=A0A1F6AQG8_9BACT|nr:MAG: hypothetical protein A2960_02200 [Candidatus Gottesmanbacteria bacterium RIFCSPLOWO2_01_FULL_39_12b]
MNIWLYLLFFLPLIESIDHKIGLNLLLSASIIINLPLLRKPKIVLSWIETLWLMILTIFSISVIFSLSYSQSLLELNRYIAYFLIFLGIRSENNKVLIMKKFYIPMIIINSIILSLIFILRITPGIKLTVPYDDFNLMYYSYGHNNISDILLFAIPLALSCLLESDFKIKLLKISLYFISILFIITFFLSLSRGAMLSLSFAFLISVFIYRKLTDKFNKWILVISLISILFLITNFISSNFIIPREIGLKFEKGLYKPAKKELRLEYIDQAIKGFIKSPIFGTGLNTFIYVSQFYQSMPLSWSGYAHNHYLELFTETGVLGGLFFLALIVMGLYSSYLNVKNDHSSDITYKICIFIALLASSLHSLLDPDWHFNSIYLFYWLGIALLLPGKKDTKDKNILVSPIYVTIIILFSLKILIPLDVDKILRQADQAYSNRNYDAAIAILLRASKLDRARKDIPVKLAKFYSTKGNYDSAHFWYKEAIKRDPFDSELLIKDNYLLYLKQAKQVLDEGNSQLAVKYIDNAAAFYPFFENYKEDNTDVKRIKEYINKSVKNMLKKPIGQYELKIYTSFID